MGARENRRYVDNRAAVTQVGGSRTRHIPGRAEQVHRGIKHGLVRPCRAHFHIGEGDITERVLGARGTGVIDQHIELAKGVYGARDNISTHLRISAVAHNCGDVLGVKALFSELLDKGIQLALVSAGHGDLGAFPEQMARDIAAYGARSASQNH